MDHDGDFDNGYESDPVESSSGFDLPNDQSGIEKDLDPFNLRDPVKRGSKKRW